MTSTRRGFSRRGHAVLMALTGARWRPPAVAGGGTTLVAAHDIDRNYLGIDVNLEAVAICTKRLHGSAPHVPA